MKNNLLFVTTTALLLVSGVTIRSAQEPHWPMRFDFGPGPVATGWVQVLPDTSFNRERGWGFEPGAIAEAVDRGGADALRRDLLASEHPLLFSVVVPEGNYRVSVTFGDAAAGSTNTVKAESRRLMLERVVTAPREFVTRSFTVNVRTPEIAGGAPVRLKDRERGVLHWDDKLTLEFDGPRSAVCGVEIAPERNVVTVYLLGDSTVTDQPREPWNSWGQMFPRFFQPEVAVANHAESGESLKSFLSARRVEKVLQSLRRGDYVFIQFGHNDQKDRATNAVAVFQANLQRLVSDVRQRGGQPVLVTSMERKSGIRTNTLAEYPAVMRAVAAESKVPLIDLQPMSRQLYLALGTNLDAAFQDGTHHNAYGSYEIARCVVEGIRAARLPLAGLLVDEVGPFDPNHPDPLAPFDIPSSPEQTDVKPDGN